MLLLTSKQSHAKHGGIRIYTRFLEGPLDSELTVEHNSNSLCLIQHRLDPNYISQLFLYGTLDGQIMKLKKVS